MYNCAGWCVLGDAGDDGARTERLNRTSAALNKKLGHEFAHFKIQIVNAEWMLVFCDAGNHGKHMQEVLKSLASEVVGLAPCSYGYFHIDDNEIDDGSRITLLRIAGSEFFIETDNKIEKLLRVWRGSAKDLRFFLCRRQ